MEKYYRFDPQVKKAMLEKYLHSQKSYTARKNVGNVLRMLGGVIVAGMTVMFTSLAGPGASSVIPIPLVGLLTGMAVGCIPFFIGTGICNKAKQEYSRPYGRMTKEFLRIDDQGLQFGYNNATSEYTESMDVYEIPFDNINKVHFDPEFDVLTILGRGRLTAYDDYQAGIVNHAKSQRAFHDNSPYSFILAFEDREEIVRLLKSKQNWED